MSIVTNSSIRIAEFSVRITFPPIISLKRMYVKLSKFLLLFCVQLRSVVVNQRIFFCFCYLSLFTLVSLGSPTKSNGSQYNTAIL
uniref:Uncharacterized protein n=1 Tax=Anguilla anguilla TaxID=7936 RepID=A0A0E9PAU6_ANGAN